MDALLQYPLSRRGVVLAFLLYALTALLVGLLLARPTAWLHRRIDPRPERVGTTAFALGLAIALASHLHRLVPMELLASRMASNWRWSLPTLLLGSAALFLPVVGLSRRIRVPGRPLGWLLGLTALGVLSLSLRARILDTQTELLPVRAVTQPESTPTVILISLDTLRADSVGHTWEGEALMPWFDGYSQRMRRYTRGYSGGNETPPGHASMLTGLYPAECGGLVTGEMHLGQEQLTVPEYLRDFGYRTIGVITNPRISRKLGFGQGCELYDETLCFERPRLADALLHYFDSSLFHALSGQRIRRAGRSLVGVALGSQRDLTRADVVSNRALELVDRADDRPLYLFLNYLDPHFPFLVSEPGLREGFGPNLVREELESARLLSKDFREKFGPIGERVAAGETTQRDHEALRWLSEAYWEQMRELDDGLRILFEGLEERGLLDDAVVLVTSDHGEHLGEHGKFLHGNSLYEELVRVPYLLIAPGVEPGIDATPVSGVDFLPTVAASLGSAPPSNLAGVALQESIPSDRLIRFETGTRRGYLVGDRKWLAVDRGTYLEWVAAFDLASDPREQNDLLDSGLPWVVEGQQSVPFEPLQGAGEFLEWEDPEAMEGLGYVGGTDG